MLRAAALLFGLVQALHASVIDRVEIVVGSTVITELQLEEDLHVTAFLNEEPLSSDSEKRSAAAQRLVQQALIRRDMELSRYPDVPAEAVDEELRELRAQYASPADFQAQLKQYGISVDTLRTHLAIQARTLRFVGFRFRPEIDIADADLTEYARKQRENWSREHPGGPEPDGLRNMAALRSRLLEERTDQALNAWLEDARNQIRITYLDPSLAPVKK